MRQTQVRLRSQFLAAFAQATGTLDRSLSPKDGLRRLAEYPFTIKDTVYLFHLALATFWIILMQQPSFPVKLLIPIFYTLALLIPLTSQFFIPATPIFAYLLTFYSSRFIPEAWRPPISVATLPTLESVLYGANISDILTRYTNPFLDIVAWIPYGVLHFTAPFIIAACVWLFTPKPTLKFWATAFGYMNLLGVICQIIFPCAAPWYELIHGLTPANYSMKGSPGGLVRIDALFHSQTYTIAFSNAPVVFGAFPSLHSGCATFEAIFLSHFFPSLRPLAWTYAGLLYWSTMYLTHHYLVDVVGGACLAVACFYFFLPPELRKIANSEKARNEAYDLEAPLARQSGIESDFSSDDDIRGDIAYRSPRPTSLPGSAKQFAPTSSTSGGRGHRHTASIASLVGPESQVEDTRSPIGMTGFQVGK